MEGVSSILPPRQGGGAGEAAKATPHHGGPCTLQPRHPISPHRPRPLHILKVSWAQRQVLEAELGPWGGQERNLADSPRL